MSANATVQVHLVPTLILEGALAGGVAVVVDVLRATSVMVRALASGCDAIIPCLEIEEARDVARALPSGSAVLAGERQGVAIEGFDFGNSPGDFTPDVCRGKTVVMTTTNGTRAILASLEADRVLIGAFANLRAIREELRNESRTVHIVCSGTDGLVSFEDTLLAGAIASHLDRVEGLSLGNDSARISARAWLSVTFGNENLDEVLRTGRGGLRVSELGLGRDIVEAGAVDTIGIVPELRRDPLRIVRAGATREGGIG
ncbi:2-phosphosulfolactate phosphatase [Tautonia rosea]|uniref:2-phosphosulfolactate phosphatase n=1 Tax=Tautonia rosea TaxID=2728037 RepID=UPI00147638FD|nr:2-phosphosulfolactate phosphatase [Tautonia rosea]